METHTTTIDTTTDLGRYASAVIWWDTLVQGEFVEARDRYVMRHARPHGDDGTETIETVATFTRNGRFHRGARIVRHADGAVSALDYRDLGTALTVAAGEEV